MPKKEEEQSIEKKLMNEFDDIKKRIGAIGEIVDGVLDAVEDAVKKLRKL